ncbi:MAG: bifunctional serine/threonine-protein kinase/formylglycine-generating enzyme family protein [Planctomycetota bacterium]
MDIELSQPSTLSGASGARFVAESSIGRGGMGEVVLLRDHDLRREVAMKVLQATAEGEEARGLFIAEAQATSQLEHPGIPPVHDIGVTGSGRPFFTMKLVRGRTLRAVLDDVTAGGGREEYTLHRLVTILERIAEALQFAHERGVVHRDIKPENIMLGDYGEVHVMDWGLARVRAASPEQVGTLRTDAGLETQLGAASGTLPYMSPEQLLGEAVDGRTDVYALGCLLYEVLTRRPAFDPEDSELVAKVLGGQYVDPSERDSGVPAPLADACRKAMAKDRDERFADARVLQDALRGWLDGRADRARRRAEAERLVAQGEKSAARHARFKEQLREAEEAAEAEAKRFKPYQPVREKRPMIEAQQRVEALRTEVALAFAETTQLLNAALTQEPDSAKARGVLAALWMQKLADAELRGDPADTAYARALVERYRKIPLPTDGSLSLTSKPVGAEVTLFRYEEIDGVLTPTDETKLGTTPLGPVPLPMGSYLCLLRKDGRRETRYPVNITRERAWVGTIRLRTDEEIGERFVHVPAGPFTYGEGKHTEIRELADFAIGRYPVTFREYAEFLDALDPAEADERCPRSPIDGPYMERGPDGRFRPLEGSIEGPAVDRCLRDYGPDYDWLVPVAGVSWHDAIAYCEWKARTTGREWRLPTEEELEKAARGVDGRTFAWGDLADATLCRCRHSRDEPPQPEPVGAFPTSASVYGMGDACGNQADWTSSLYEGSGSPRVQFGGSWLLSMDPQRCAFRSWSEPHLRSGDLGFRCARSLG